MFIYRSRLAYKLQAHETVVTVKLTELKSSNYLQESKGIRYSISLLAILTIAHQKRHPDNALLYKNPTAAFLALSNTD